MSDGWDGIPADVFSEILRRMPLCPRRRLRLVCRHWHDVIDERAPEPRTHAKVLAFFTERGGGGGGRELDLQGSGAELAGARMIGTCSNLLYVRRESGEIEAIDVAARLMLGTDPPAAGPSGEHESTYTFGCHPETGLHKLVHVPCHESTELDAVHVLTLEDGLPPAGVAGVLAPAGVGLLPPLWACQRRRRHVLGHQGRRADHVVRPHGRELRRPRVAADARAALDGRRQQADVSPG